MRTREYRVTYIDMRGATVTAIVVASSAREAEMEILEQYPRKIICTEVAR